MTGLERITEKILADAKERARVILEAAQSDCRAAAEQYAATAAEKREEIAARAMAEGEAIAARARAAATMERRDILLAARAEVLDEVFLKAKKEITDTDFGKYRELLVALLSCALFDLSAAERTSRELGDEVEEITSLEVLMNEKDRARFGDAVLSGARRVTERRVGGELLSHLTLSNEIADIEGGLILRAGDVEINCSLTVLLAEVRREIEGKVSKILFPQ